VKKRASPVNAAPATLGTQFEDADASPGFVLWQVATLWQRALRAALNEVGLTHAQFVLLACAAWLEGRPATKASGGVTQADIAAHARTDVVMTSEVLRTLERKTLLKRLPHPSDARAKQIALTPSGRRLANKAVALVEAADSSFFGARGPELRTLARLLCVKNRDA
jgi:DNA-binding MarR family transcriptional regulator